MDDRTMRFGLMRHGMAENGSVGQPDYQRRLTAEGRRRLVVQADWLRADGLSFDVLVSSPLVRAEQTAAIIAERLGLETSTDSLLASGCSPDDVVELLSRFNGSQSPLLVGHQPDLSTTVAVLTGRHVNFGEGDIAVLERRAGRYELIRHIPAERQRR
jgi:phosphohistidine phosphatase